MTAPIIYPEDDEEESGWHPRALAEFKRKFDRLAWDIDRVGGKLLSVDIDLSRALYRLLDLYVSGLPPKKRAKFLEASLECWPEIQRLEEKLYRAAQRHIREHLRRGVDPKEELEPEEYAEFMRLWSVRVVRR